MEKSLIIVCKDTSIVTAIAFAVTNLLLPFTWQGVFIPLLPNDVREVGLCYIGVMFMFINILRLHSLYTDTV